MQSKGFTLIELFVVIAIIAILSSALFLGKTSGEEKLALQRSTFILAQDLREVQEMAMGAQEFSCLATITHSFGVNFDLNTTSTAYYLFADCNADRSYSQIDDEILREVKLEKGVEIVNLEIQAISTSTLDIVFLPPDPIVYIQKSEWGVEGTITLGLKSETKKLKINTAGRIEIE